MFSHISGICNTFQSRSCNSASYLTVAALPAGANSFLFSQRYRVAEDTVTTTVGLSTLLGLVTVPVVMVLVRGL